MATMLDRLREGLIWTYAALSLAEEQQLKSRQWWEQEGIRFKEEARARLDSTLRELEERRAQRRAWMRTRVSERLGGSGIATREQLDALQARIDALTAEVERLRGPTTQGAVPPRRVEDSDSSGATTAAPHVVLPTDSSSAGSAGAEGSSSPPDMPPTP